eukprot:TRINITY_DN16195_c0_g2_i1.p1 TRINITY_DN16195_c0_g2~~TRINITY_DN16195_c0_g2_i1.p1  ORF type:complete len:430 (+),score=89.26 TRINITY_DN16195_c0_g2_i1:80-1369(+)
MALPGTILNGCLVVGMLFFGSYNTINLKLQYSTCAPSTQPATTEVAAAQCPPGQRHFDKPWLQNWTMFLGELMLLPIYAIGRAMSARRRTAAGKKPRAGDGTSPFVFVLPACCDIFGTGLSCVGLMFISAAVWQMMRGAIIIFTSLFTVFFLGKRLLAYHWLGISLTTLGLGCVGVAAFGEAENQSAGNGLHALIGIALVLTAQVAQAFQFVFEEHLLKGRRVSAKKVVGMEGFWGACIMGVLLVVFNYVPGSDNGVLQDGPDALQMYTASGSKPLVVLTMTYMVSIATYNFFCLNVTKRISAVTRCLIDSCRMMVIWVVSLALYYSGDTANGVPWTPYSWWQLGGFVLLVLGSLVYNEVLRLPFLSYAQANQEKPYAALMSPKPADAGALDDYQVSPVASPADHLQKPLLSDGKGEEQPEVVMNITYD